MSRYILPWTLTDIEALRRVAPFGIITTPALNRSVPEEEAVVLKCENLQKTGSFKYRGAASAMYYHRAEGGEVWQRMLRFGVASSSTGNFGRALAAVTRDLGLRCRIYLHDAVPPFKAQALEAVNPSVEIVRVPYEGWRGMMTSSVGIDDSLVYLSAETDPYTQLGYATIAHEIVEQVPNVRHVLVPYGGGALALSLAETFRQLAPQVQVHAVELETGAPFSASLAQGKPTRVAYTPSFVDSIGADFVIPQNFAANRQMLADSLVVSLASVANAIQRLVIEDRIVAEGAGAAALAAAHAFASQLREKGGNICCLISGGIISAALLARILEGSDTTITI
uniref:Threonine dehydratase n=1 Tax=Candidatus Kentrum sp. SD TaxID=2126332 RepID=A0A451BLH9_9GAMM|nr:MAG: threonine dehydratase [Candidatus Kentron sp. SD]